MLRLLFLLGYGESTGTPSEDGLIIDAETAFDHLVHRADMDKTKVVVFGRSLGGAVATALTTKHSEEIRGLMIENSFTSISDMVDQLFPLLRPLKRFILRLDWKSIQRIGRITAPILFISGLQDEVVPCDQMQTLHDAAVGARFKSMFRISNGTHNDSWIKGGPAYLKEMRTFICSCIGAAVPTAAQEAANEVEDLSLLETLVMQVQASQASLSAMSQGQAPQASPPPSSSAST